LFLVADGRSGIERRVRQLFGTDPSVGLVVAAVFFEWTACRALICLSKTPNRELRTLMQEAHGLGAYKDLWAREAAGSPRLPTVVRDWHALTRAFTARNVLVHGRDRYTRNMAAPHFGP
jgi:hypothetical protein